MDFVRLVEYGGYDPEEIADPRSRGIVEGIAIAIDDVRCCLDNLAVDLDDGTMRSKLEAERAAEIGSHILRWMEGTRCEHIVSILDREACEREAGE